MRMHPCRFSSSKTRNLSSNESVRQNASSCSSKVVFLMTVISIFLFLQLLNGITTDQHEINAFMLKTFNHLAIVLVEKRILHTRIIAYKPRCDTLRRVLVGKMIYYRHENDGCTRNRQGGATTDIRHLPHGHDFCIVGILPNRQDDNQFPKPRQGSDGGQYVETPKIRKRETMGESYFG